MIQCTTIGRRIGSEGRALALCLRSGLIAAQSPHKMMRIVLAMNTYGPFGAAATIGAVRFGDRAALIDELGTLSHRQLDERSNALARAWRDWGLEAGDGVAVLARNHRGFLDATFAAAKCGARIVLLNTDFSGPQIRDVARREGIDLLVHDDEYSHMLTGVAAPKGKWRAWAEAGGADTIEALIAAYSSSPPPKPRTVAKVVILTSGTTGTPKGAQRGSPRSLIPFGGILSKVPLRAGEVTEVCAPMFHALGFAHALLAILLGSTLIVRRRFDPRATLDSVRRNRVTTLVVVPIMLQRMLDLGVQVHSASLRIVFVAGSRLGSPLCQRALDAFGPVLYNLYGSTEVAQATIATPHELMAEPGCVGSVVPGAVVKIFDECGRELRAGQTGAIYVGNSITFEGYTDGGTKETIGGLLATGDIGHFDASGRLFIDGRADEMIVSGGENVFPAEVEETLARHNSIVEAAAIGVEDAEFGQRLRAFVVLRDGASLTAEEIKEYVRGELARFKAPRDVIFVDRLPRNPTGKVLKRELADPERNRAGGHE